MTKAIATKKKKPKSFPRQSRFAIEAELHAQGFSRVAGIDEAGRGPLAGPVCAAVVVFEPGARINKVNDSKLLDPELREELYAKIVERAVGYGVGLACAEEIDTINILRATKLAVRRALRNMKMLPDHLLLDALHLENCTIPQKAFVKGDSRCFSIAAASIIAKVTRDRIMTNYASEYPGYGFEQHKGYAVPEHKAALRDLGPCTLHRKTFLEQWFGTDKLRNSNTFVNFRHQLDGCMHCEPVHGLLDTLTALQASLPKCEWTELHQSAHTRLALLNSALHS
ncbi:MAG: ribonuclease HII [Candidatus Sumerlaeaceae bacterium]